MATRYLEILALSRPAPIGVDTNNRTMFTATYNCVAAAPATKFEEEVARILFDASLMTLGTDGFIGPASTIPTGNGPYITLIDTGGMSPLETHNGDKYERMSIQIVVRALNYQVARTRALAIWRELDGKRNVSVTAA